MTRAEREALILAQLQKQGREAVEKEVARCVAIAATWYADSTTTQTEPMTH